MSEWKAKRFWKAATTNKTEGGFEVLLDGRSVRTPAKAHLIVPTLQMAQEIAVEWDAQSEVIDPLTMPVTRGANAAIDKVAVQKAEVVNLIAAYGESDLLCYRAGEPVELIKRQRDAWDPVLEWCEGTFGAPLDIAEGLMHIAQPDASVANLKSEVSKLTAFQLAGFYDLVSMSGSLVLALAVTHDFIDVEKAWKTSRIDEDWQIEQWGEDDEASATALVKQNAFVSAAKFYKIS